MKKKVCFLVNTIFSIGGIQRAVTTIANEMISRGYNVNIICLDNRHQRNNSIYCLNKKIEVVFIPESKIEKYLTIWGRVIKKIILKSTFLQKRVWLVSLCYFKRKFIQKAKIIRYIRKNNFDFLISAASECTMYSTLLKHKVSTKIFGWQHSSCYAYFEDTIDPTGLKYMYKSKIHLLDNYIVLTEDDKNWIKRNFNYDSICIYNPKSFFSNEKSDLKSKNFIAVGRYSQEKGFERLIEAFNLFSKKNKDWNLLIVGEGPLKEKLESLINSYNLKDRIILVPKTNDIKKYYLKSSIYLLSSYIEGLPMVLIEACECGLPIITYDLPCCVEQFADCSLIVKNDDIKEYSKSMESLINNEKLLRKLSEKSIVNSKKYEMDQIFEKWEELLLKK